MSWKTFWAWLRAKKAPPVREVPTPPELANPQTAGALDAEPRETEACQPLNEDD